jgi:site-specific recombinase XerD
VIRYWRSNRLKKGSIALYVRWVRRFQGYDAQSRPLADQRLTRDSVMDFVRGYARAQGLDPAVTRSSACVALHAWSMALAALGYKVPAWAPAARPSVPRDPLLVEFAEHQRRHRGTTGGTIAKQLDHTAAFLAFLRRRRRHLDRIQLRDVDAFVVLSRERYATTTVADMCSSLRVFLRFLCATHRLHFDIATSVAAPVIRRGARLPRALPWSDVTRILRAVDRSARCGRRDLALLLLMATYGMGAAEAITLKLDDIDWRAATLRVTRPKTGVPILLPLLPPVARALVSYLRHGRPPGISRRVPPPTSTIEVDGTPVIGRTMQLVLPMRHSTLVSCNARYAASATETHH